MQTTIITTCFSFAILTILMECLSHNYLFYKFACIEDLRPSQLNGAMSSVVSLPNHTFTGQA